VRRSEERRCQMGSICRLEKHTYLGIPNNRCEGKNQRHALSSKKPRTFNYVLQNPHLPLDETKQNITDPVRSPSQPHSSYLPSSENPHDLSKTSKPQTFAPPSQFRLPPHKPPNSLHPRPRNLLILPRRPRTNPNRAHHNPIHLNRQPAPNNTKPASIRIENPETGASRQEILGRRPGGVH
jgi:hypothetical protein